jgi:hypothetical protein
LAHVKTEFGFDVLEIAQGRFAPDSYHDFIGFGVSVPLLEQAFQETYGLDLKSVLSDENKVLGSYRYDVARLLPKATRIAWSLKKDEIIKDQPGVTSWSWKRGFPSTASTFKRAGLRSAIPPAACSQAKNKSSLRWRGISKNILGPGRTPT